MNKIAAVFTDAGNLMDALSMLENNGIRTLDIYSPVPLKGYGKFNSRLKNISAFTLTGAVLGFLIGLAIQYGITNNDYRLNLGGRPFFHLAWSVPVIFELTILCAALAAFIGFLFVTSLPRWYPDNENFTALHDQAMSGKFVLVFEPDGSKPVDELSEILKEKNAVLRILQ